MVLLNEDPSIDIDNAKEIDLVIKAGKVIDRQTLHPKGLH